MAASVITIAVILMLGMRNIMSTYQLLANMIFMVVDIETAEADMTLLQLSPQTDFTKEVFPDLKIPHQRLQSSITAVCGKFLNFFYPNKPGMK